VTVVQLAHAQAARQLAEFCETHLPDRARVQVRLESAWRGDTVTLIERRAPWDGPGDWTSRPIARFRYEPDGKTWHVYWQRADGRWLEATEIRSASFPTALRAVGRDRNGIFWG
jgi:hypothetical protein